MAGGYFKAAYENVPGNEANTPTLSTKTIYVPVMTTKVDHGTEHLRRDDELRGLDEPSAFVTESYEPKWEANVRAYPDALGFYLKALLGAPTTTAGNGVITGPDAIVVPTGATKHVWTAPFYQGAFPQTFEGIWGYLNQAVFFKLKGAAVDTLEIETPDKGGANIKVSGPGLFLARVADPSLTPAYESMAIKPFLKSGLTLTWLSGSATVQDFSVSCSAPVDTTRTLQASSKWPDLAEKGEGLITWTGSVNNRTIDPEDWDALIAATGFAATAKWLSDSFITGAFPYKLFVEMSNAQLTGGDVDDLTNARRRGASYQFEATRNASASVTVTLINATASYA